GAHGVVELADTAEPGGGRDLGERDVNRLDEDAGRHRPLRSRDRERSGTELAADDEVEVACAVVRAPGGWGDTFAVDDAVGDEAHRPGDGVLAHVPLRRTRRRVGPAALARPVAVVVSCGSGGEELDVGTLRGDGRTARPAVDPRRLHGGEE